MRLGKRLAHFVFIIAALSALAGCSFKKPQAPSIIVILVEGLSFSAVSCSEGADGEADENEVSGFQAMCRESVRFTHAFSPSVLGQSAVASVLTARYPFEHGVWHNGSQFLSARLNTLAEVALASGYRTALFSGGAPVWRKAGLNQGFEIFDDSITPSLTRLYRPVSEVVRLFLEWRTEDVKKDKSLGVLFLGDLQFTDVATTDELGVVRESSYESQLHEVDLSIGKMIDQLKRTGQWAGSTVILAGLNGYPVQGRLTEIKPVNLYSEGTRVTLMIKPAVRSHESSLSRKVDTNVSLVDLGATLYDLLGAAIPKPNRPELAPQSLVPAMKGPANSQASLKDDRRWIMSSSAYCGQQGFACGTRVALREGALFYIFDQNRKLYNTLADSFETSPMPGGNPLFSKAYEFERFLREKGLAPWTGLARPFISKVETGKLLWHTHGPTPESLDRLRRLSGLYENDHQLQGWRAVLAIRRADWRELKAVAKVANYNQDWLYVAERNLQEENVSRANECLIHGSNLLRGRGAETPRNCREQELSSLYQWISEGGDDSGRQRALENFARLYMLRMIDQRVAEQNLVADADWDVSLTQPSAPTTVDLVLALPEARKFRLILRDRLKI